MRYVRTYHSWYFLSQLFQAIEVVVKRIMPKTKTHYIIDFGADDSPYQALLTPLADTYVVCNIGDKAELKSINKNLCSASFIPGQELPISDSQVDLVLSTQVLEHVDDVPWYLGEVRRVLKDNGYLILSTHGVWPYHPHPNDYYRWTWQGLEKDISQAGFNIEEMISIAGPVAWVILLPLIGLCAQLEKVFLGKFIAKIISFLANSIVPIIDNITPKNLKKENAAIYVVVAKKNNHAVAMHGGC